jgi:hypothetical protein
LELKGEVKTMKLLAYCPHCKKIFVSNMFGNASPGTTVKDCQESCPECGKMAQTSNYLNNMMYIAGQEFHTASDDETLKNILKILQY